MSTVLICDDEKDIVSALDIYLRAEGYDTVAAYNGREAVEKLREQEIQLVLLDIMMPQMDGVTALGEMKRREGSLNDDTPVVALTANALAGAREGYLRQGFDEYLSKPIDAELLEEILMRFIPQNKLES